MDKKLTLIACVDERMGLMFNRRRQSKDRAMRERLLARLGGRTLWMSPYSARLFGEEGTVHSSDAFWDKAEGGDALFMEDVHPPLAGIGEVILYRWGEHYPADVYFPYDLEKEGFRLVGTEEFVGSSHEKITEDVYRRETL